MLTSLWLLISTVEHLQISNCWMDLKNEVFRTQVKIRRYLKGSFTLCYLPIITFMLRVYQNGSKDAWAVKLAREGGPPGGWHEMIRLHVSTQRRFMTLSPPAFISLSLYHLVLYLSRCHSLASPPPAPRFFLFFMAPTLYFDFVFRCLSVPLSFFISDMILCLSSSHFFTFLWPF